MKTSIELKELRSDIISQLENIKDVASTEKRDLTEDEKRLIILIQRLKELKKWNLLKEIVLLFQE